jgi:hypothetical protein
MVCPQIQQRRSHFLDQRIEFDLRLGTLPPLGIGPVLGLVETPFNQFPDASFDVRVELTTESREHTRTRKLVRKFGNRDLLVESLGLSSNGRRILLGGTNEMQLWEVGDGRLLKRFTKLNGSVSVAFSPDGRYALSGEMWGRVRFWALPMTNSGKSKE